MIIAAFRPGAPAAGQTIEYDNGAFWLTRGPQLTVAQVTAYDAAGQLEWAYPGLQEWAYEVSRAPGSSPAASSGFSYFETTTSEPGSKQGLSRGAKAGLWIGGGVLLLVLAVVAVYFAARRGDEVRPGVKVVYRAATRDGATPSRAQMEATVDVLDRRLEELDVENAEIELQGADQISIVLPDDVKDVDEALGIVGKTGRLEFYDDAATRLSGPEDSLEWAIRQAQDSPLISLETGEKQTLKKLAAGENSPELLVVRAPAGTMGEGSGDVYFVYRDEPAMGGAAIDNARQAYDAAGNPNVEIEFTDEGGKQFEEVTKELARRGSIKGTPQAFAIVLDDIMESDPIIDPMANPNGIAGGRAVIEGDFTLDEAKDLALVLNSGSLPVTLKEIQQQSP